MTKDDIKRINLLTESVSDDIYTITVVSQSVDLNQIKIIRHTDVDKVFEELRYVVEDYNEEELACLGPEYGQDPPIPLDEAKRVFLQTGYIAGSFNYDDVFEIIRGINRLHKAVKEFEVDESVINQIMEKLIDYGATEFEVCGEDNHFGVDPHIEFIKPHSKPWPLLTDMIEFENNPVHGVVDGIQQDLDDAGYED